MIHLQVATAIMALRRDALRRMGLPEPDGSWRCGGGYSLSWFPHGNQWTLYHPQHEAFLPLFEFVSPSSAIHGAYGYPDETLLPALSPVRNAFCF
jgi:hypothetical protein